MQLEIELLVSVLKGLYAIIALEVEETLNSLTSTATATLVSAFVTAWLDYCSTLYPRLDYCSTLYPDLPALRLGCLERVIRTAAHLIGGIPRTGHVSAYHNLLGAWWHIGRVNSCLDVLHWLPLHHWIMFCIAVGQEVPSGPCSGLPPRSLLSHPGHQRL